MTSHLAPHGSNGSDAAVCRCGAGQHPEDPSRCAHGHVVAGNQLGVVHNERSRVFWETSAAIVNERYEELVRDQGHPDPASAPQALRIACAALARASILEESIYFRVASMGGPISADGRVRRAHQRWESVFDRVLSALRVVGLQRVADVPLTLDQVLRDFPPNPEEGGDDDA